MPCRKSIKAIRSVTLRSSSTKCCRAVAAEHLAEYCDIFCERGYFDIETSRRILNAAQRHGLRLRMHVDQLTNSGGAQLAAELGAATADHLEQTEDDGIAALTAGGCPAGAVARDRFTRWARLVIRARAI